MPKYILPFLKIIYSSLFLGVLCNHILHFTTKYLQFSTSIFINENHLQFAYFFLIFFEFISVFIFLINRSLIVNYVYSFFALFYFTFLIFLLYYINDITGGCIDCHFIAKYIFENVQTTISITVFLFLLYFYIFSKKIFAK